MHALTLSLYPKRGVRYIPPKALREQEQIESDFEGLQEEIDDLDDLICGEDDFFIQISDLEFKNQQSTLTRTIKENKSMVGWERTLLLFELDLIQVGWDIRKMKYEDNISKEVQRNIETLLASGQQQALPTIYEYYRRRQESALNDFFFEKAYEESLALLTRLDRKQNNLSELDLSLIRSPLRGRVLSTFGRIVAIHAHSYEAPTELERAKKLFTEAEAELVHPEERAQQQLLIVHTLLEKKRINPKAHIDDEIDSFLPAIDKKIELFVEDKLPSEIFRIDLRIACRLKIALLRKEKYNMLSRLSARVAQEIQSVEEHLHHPWEQICGLIYALQPHNTPRNIRELLDTCAQIRPDTEESLLGLIARGYLLEGKYRKGEEITTKDQEEFVHQLPSDAQSWWEQYDIGSRFSVRCAQNTLGSPIDVFPFDMS
jgi:hypothetical protein